MLGGGGRDVAATINFPTWAWAVLVGLVAGLLFLDLFVFHRGARKIPFKEALVWTGFWITVALGFGGFIWYLTNPAVAAEYLAAYLVEWSLSLDNVFVWAVIFTSFAVPEEYRYHVLFWGVMGALVFRAIFVIVGMALLSTFSWLVFVFGAFLIFTGIRMFREDPQEEQHPEDNRVLKLLRRRMPFTSDYHGDHFFVKNNGARCATPLVAVLVVIETSDLIFAVDSVPAVLGITSSTFVAYSAIAFAVLGLRHLYFALEGLMNRFTYLHYGLSAILIFVGVKFLLEGFGVHLPILASLLPIAGLLAVSIAASWYFTRDGDPGTEGDG